jgi:hypothetical protein
LYYLIILLDQFGWITPLNGQQNEDLDDEQKPSKLKMITNVKDLSQITEKTNDISRLSKIYHNDKYEDHAEVIEEIYEKYGKADPDFTEPTAEQIAGIVLALYSGLNSIGICFPKQRNADDVRKNYAIKVMLADLTVQISKTPLQQMI